MAARASDSPRVRVAAVIPRDGRLVVVRHRHGQRKYHLLPGGGVERNETLNDALVREVREETGLRVRLERPLFVNDTIDPEGRRHLVNITFLCSEMGGELLARPEDRDIDGTEVVSYEELSRLDLRPPIANEIAQAAREGFDGPALYLGSVWTPELGAGST